MQTRDPDFPVDLVFTWVDGSDPVHAEKRRRFQAAYPDTEIRLPTRADADLQSRHVDAGEIVFSVRSVLAHLPWVRTLFIVTDNQQPPVDASLIETGRVRVIDHRDIIPEPYLPTFSSRVVESCLHRIPGLSDVFLYNNDDYMHFAPVRRETLVTRTPDGRARLVLHANLAALQHLKRHVSRVLPRGLQFAHLHTIGISNACTLLRERDRRLRARHLLVPRHSTQVIRRSTAERLDATFADVLDRNRRIRFRSVRSLSYATLLYTMERQWHPDDVVNLGPGREGVDRFEMLDFTGPWVRGETDKVWRRVAASRAPFACLNNIPAADRDRLREVMARKGLHAPRG